MFLTTLAAAPRSGLCLPAATGAVVFAVAGLSTGFSVAGFAGAGCAAAAGFSAGFGAGFSAGAGRPLLSAELSAEELSRSAAPTGLPGR
jgi:hypothetical protein